MSRWQFIPTASFLVVLSFLYSTANTTFALEGNNECDSILARYSFESLSDAEIRDGVAYLVSGSQFEILRLVHPAAPIYLSLMTLPETNDYERGKIAVLGSYAYVYLSETLFVISIRDPFHPSIESSIAVSASCLTTDGSFVYLVDRDMVTIIEVSSPRHPRILSEFPCDELSWPKDIVVANGYLYIGDSKLIIIDVSSPEVPFPVSNRELPGSAEHVLQMDDYLYLSSPSIGLMIYDVSNPWETVEIGSYDCSYYGLAVSGGTAALMETPTWHRDYATLHLLDVSVPSSIVETASVNIDGIDHMYIRDIISGSHYLYSIESNGLRIFDLSTPENPSITRFFPTPTYGYDIAISGNFAFAAVGDAGLQVFELNPIESIHPVAVIDTHGEAMTVTISHNFVFCGTRNGKLKVYDISDPRHPVVISDIRVASSISNMEACGKLLLTVPESGSTSSIIDISNPHSPQKIGILRVGHPIGDITISGHLVYVAYKQGLAIFDLSDAQNPVELSSLDLVDEIDGQVVLKGYDGIAVRSGLAYLYNSISSRVIDVSTPDSPVEILKTENNANWTTVYCINGGDTMISGDFLYQISDNSCTSADSSSTIWISDITDPSSPQRVGSIRTDTFNYIRNLFAGHRYNYAIGSSITILPRCVDIPLIDESLDFATSTFQK